MKLFINLKILCHFILDLNALCFPQVYRILHITSYASKRDTLYSALLANHHITPSNPKFVVKSDKKYRILHFLRRIFDRIALCVGSLKVRDTKCHVLKYMMQCEK